MTKSEIGKLNIRSPLPFIKMHFSWCINYANQSEAYEALENEYKKHTGRRRYASFDSFSRVRNRIYKS